MFKKVDLNEKAKKCLFEILGKENEPGKFNYVYPMTTENLSGYFPYINNFSKVLCVAGSGDHMLNCVANGSFVITMFDVNPITYYLVKLKIGALSLSKSGFLDFFTVEKDWDTYSPGFFNFDTYELIRDKLEDDVQDFWDTYYKWLHEYNLTPQTSELFRHIRYSRETIMKANQYLSDEVYNSMYKMVKKVNISFINENLSNLFVVCSEEKFNTILLSNISDYISGIFGIEGPEVLTAYNNFTNKIVQENLAYGGQLFYAYIYEATTSPRWTVIDQMEILPEHFKPYIEKTFPAICRAYRDDYSKVDCVLIKARKANLRHLSDE